MTQDKALKILKTGANVFLTGEPGSGKSFTINMFRDWLKDQGIPYAVTASTGIAATHIGGVTIHSWSGMGIKEVIAQKDVDNIIYNKPFVVKKLHAVRVLIIDEISMLNADALDNVDMILRGVRGDNSPFGGVQVVFVGDFFQLPPVSKFDKKVRFAFESDAWKEAGLVYCYLHEQHRQSDPQFLEILTAMRQGEVTEEHKKILKSAGSEAAKISTQLFTHNLDVDRINNIKLRKIDEEEHEFVMTSSGSNQYLIDMLKKNCLSPERLVLKKGAVVMFTRNKFDDERTIYVNGTLGEVIGFDNEMPIVKTTDGERIYVELAEWSIEDHYGSKSAAIQQLPLKLAWAVTIHKSQGMSLDAARIDLSKAFEYGQGYVAISRVRSLKGLCIEGMNDQAMEMHPRVVEEDDFFRQESDMVDAKY